MSAPRLLDLFCCEGGAARGYQRAGFDVTGVDVLKRFARRYAGDRFVHADAVEYALQHAQHFDVVHASPPCQRYTHGNVGSGAASKHPDLVGPTRDVLVASGKPYVIENVPRAPLLNPLTLCGSMFDLRAVDTDGTTLWLRRHRLFESNMPLYAPSPCRHDASTPIGGVYGGGRTDRHEARHVRRGGYTPRDKRVREQLLGIDWMTQHGLAQSLPPVYTQWLGSLLVEML